MLRGLVFMGIVWAHIGCSGGGGPHAFGRSPHVYSDMLLRRHGEQLYIVNAPRELGIDDWFRVLTPSPLGQKSVNVVVAYARHSRALEVEWLCPPDPATESTLDDIGFLQVDQIDLNESPRVGRCWGRYDRQGSRRGEDEARPHVELDIDLGRQHGVCLYDQYDILGDTLVDRDRRTVSGFEWLGTCTVVRSSARRSKCQVDAMRPSSIWDRPFGHLDEISGGHIRAKTRRGACGTP